MLRHLNLIMPFYCNPEMLKTVHLPAWEDYSIYLKEHMQIILVDDGSPKGEDAASVLKGINKKDYPPIRLFKLKQDKPWNQHECRNIGVHHTNKGDWNFITDMDLVLTKENAEKLILLENPSDKMFFTVERLKVTPEGKEPYHYHPNTFVVHTQTYKKVNGYNTNYEGYGGDGPFKRDLEKVATRIHLSDVFVEYYGRTYITDSGTNTYDRKGELKELYRKSFDKPENRVRWDFIKSEYSEVEL